MKKSLIFTIKDGLPSNKINNLGLDNFGNVWGVTDQGLFSIIDSEITNYATKYDFKNLNYHRLSIGKNGIGWRQGNGILSSFDGENVKNYFSNDSITIDGGNSGILALDDGNVLIGGFGLKILYTNDGLGVFKKISDSGWINGITYTFDKNIIYSDASLGLVILDKLKKVKLFNEENGFIFDEPTTVFVDKKGWIWSAHLSGGVGFYNGNMWGYLNSKDGLHSNRINSISQSKNGDYVFHNSEGYTKYKPSVSDGVVSIDEIGTAKKNYLEHEKTPIKSIVKERIRLNFSSRSQSNNSTSSKYKVSLESKKVSYDTITNNPYFDWYPERPGIYQIDVQSIDRDLNYSNRASISLEIVRPWYYRASFYLPFLGIFGVFSLCPFLHTQIIVNRKSLAKN